jgi:putative two-component system protein, hydrogenase maturation factor HypX/HoxX
MRILLLATSYNGLCQRAHIELEELGHDVSISLSVSEDEMRTTVSLCQPDLIICPFLKERVPEDIWKSHRCIIIHPGIPGDRGPSSLDWAITENRKSWGVTALQASNEMDAGDIWSSTHFEMRVASKASIYRREVTEAAMCIIADAVRKFQTTGFMPEPLDYSNADVKGTVRPSMKQVDRRIDWSRDRTDDIVRKIHAADSAPGVLDTILGEEYYLHGAHKEEVLRGGPAGQIIAQRCGAICLATTDGAVWVSHLKRKSAQRPQKPRSFKLPAALLLKDKLGRIPESPEDFWCRCQFRTFREIWYKESNGVGYLHFDFHNGAMHTEQCKRLKEAYVYVRSRPVKVIVLLGGTDFWSNGIHLNVIEAANSPADESWRNINAIDDLVLEIINTTSCLTVSALWGSAGAGGAIMSLAADRVWARAGCVVNPHYKTMGLYGSEYWTYLLPKRVGSDMTIELTESALPVGMQKAKRMGLIDEIMPNTYSEFVERIKASAGELAHHRDYDRLLCAKVKARERDEMTRPLQAYRNAELQKMFRQFYDAESVYHSLRRRFVEKAPSSETGRCMATHSRFNFSPSEHLRQRDGRSVLPATAAEALTPY